MTDGGRTVYGGGGITPDEKYAPAKLNRFQIDVLRKQAFFNFTARFFAGRDTKLPKGWEPDQNVDNDFHQFLLKEGLQFSEAEYTENHAWLKQQLRREIYITAFSVDDARRLSIETDPVMAKAIDALPKAKALLESAKKLIVQRTQRPER
jgi:carboxyl-terminal processing protease